MQRNVIFQRQGRAGLQDLVRAGVGGMRGDGGNDQRMVFPGGDEFFGVFQRILIGSGVRCGEFQDGLAADRAQACFGRGLGDIRFEVVHVHKGGHTAADRFSAGQLGAQTDEFR